MSNLWPPYSLQVESSPFPLQGNMMGRGGRLGDNPPRWPASSLHLVMCPSINWVLQTPSDVLLLLGWPPPLAWPNYPLYVSFPTHLVPQRPAGKMPGTDGIANAHQLCDPLDSANRQGRGPHTAFLRPVESRELCLCVFIGFLGYGTRDGWCGNRGERVPDK